MVRFVQPDECRILRASPATAIVAVRIEYHSSRKSFWEQVSMAGQRMADPKGRGS